MSEDRLQGGDRRETVNHPAHYGGDTTYEAIKVIEAWGLGFHLGNTVKYICRAGKKSPTLEDLMKARWYLNRRIDQLERLALVAETPHRALPQREPGTKSATATKRARSKT